MTSPPPQGLAIISDTPSEERLRQDVFPRVMLSGRVNLFVLPSPDAANIPYSLARVMTNGVTTGPIPTGLDQLAHVLAPHATEHDVVNMTAIACIDGRVRLLLEVACRRECTYRAGVRTNDGVDIVNDTFRWRSGNGLSVARGRGTLQDIGGGRTCTVDRHGANGRSNTEA